MKIYFVYIKIGVHKFSSFMVREKERNAFKMSQVQNAYTKIEKKKIIFSQLEDRCFSSSIVSHHNF